MGHGISSKERRGRGGGASPLARARAGGLLFVFAAAILPLVGCETFGRVGPPKQRALLTPPKHPITVEATISPDFRDRYITALDRLSVRSAQRELVLWHSRPRTTDYAVVPPQEKGIASVALTEEGIHLLAAAPLGAPPIAASVEVIVDRQAPRARLRFERLTRSSQEGTHFRLRWYADDPYLAPRACRLEHRLPSGTWETLSSELVSSGSILFPWPVAAARQSTLRFTARDIAGNETLIEVPLDRAFDQREWVGSAGEAAVPEFADGEGAVEPAVSERRSRPSSAGVEGVAHPGARGAESSSAREPSRLDESGPIASAPTPSDPRGVTPATAIPPTATPVTATPLTHTPLTPTRDGSIRWPVRSGDILAAGSDLPAPIRGAVVLRSEEGTSIFLEREGNRLRIPAVDGARFALTARGETSPIFAIDGKAPELTLVSLDPDERGVRITWSVGEPEEPGGVAVHATIVGAGAPTEPVPLSDSPAFIELPLGDHTVTLTARDARGHEAIAPTVAFTVGVAPPQVRDLAGEVLPGGTSRYLLIEHGAAVGALRVKILPVPEGPTLEVIEVEAGARMLLWEVPPVDGRFTWEIEWSDANGDPHVRRGSTPFSIDASPPQPEATLVSARVRDTITVRLEGDEALEVAAVVRRRSDASEWVPLEEGWRAEAIEAGALAVVIDGSAWGEGPWGTGVVIRDRFGRLADEAIVTGRVVIDRTAPVVTIAAQVSATVEGVPFGVAFRVDEPLAEHRVSWESRGVRLPIESRALDVGPSAIALEVGTLPAGEGRLILEGSDAAGNRVRGERPLSVEAALTDPIVLYPEGRVVPPGDEIFVEVPLSEAAAVSAAVELRLVEVGVGSADRIRARRTLADVRRVSFRAPEQTGEYRIEIAPEEGAPFTDGVVTFTVDPQADPERRQRALVAEVSAWEARLREQGMSERVRAEREALVSTLGRELANDPRREIVRRALARLHFLADPRRVDLAAEVLQEGLRLALPADARAALLNDLAVISIEYDAPRARDLLARAVDLDPTALRHRNLADVELRLGNHAAAAESYVRSLELDPTSSIARERWATAMGTGAKAGRGRELEPVARRHIEAWHAAGQIDTATSERLYRIACGIGGSSR